MGVLFHRNMHLRDLRKLYLIVRQKTFTWARSNSFSENDFDEDTKGEKVLVATEKNTTIGFISIWEPENFIHHLYILPNYQNMGIGKKLINTAILELDIPLRLKCLEQNIRALEFYIKNGWVVKDEGIDSLGKYLLLEYNI